MVYYILLYMLHSAKHLSNICLSWAIIIEKEKEKNKEKQNKAKAAPIPW